MRLHETFQVRGFSSQQQPRPEGNRTEEPDQLGHDRSAVGVGLERLEQRAAAGAQPVDVASVGADDDANEAEAPHVSPHLRCLEHLKDSFFEIFQRLDRFNFKLKMTGTHWTEKN